MAEGGELWALQLDAKATFDRLVAREAPSPEARERILANRIYKHLSEAVAGSQGYMAVERLHELVDQGSYDVIVLDAPLRTRSTSWTPPRGSRDSSRDRRCACCCGPRCPARTSGGA